VAEEAQRMTRQRDMTQHLLLTTVVVAAFLAVPQAGARRLTGDAVLRSHARFTSDDLQRVSNGEAVARLLDAADDEVAIGGAVRIRVPASYYSSRFRAIETFKRDNAVLQIGRFRERPASSDLASLQLGRRDIDDLRGCRPGECRIKLDAAGISRFASMQSTPGTDQQLFAAFTDHLAAYAASYVAGGNHQLIEYRDHDQPRLLLSGLHQIMHRSHDLADAVPAMAHAIGGFNGSVPDGVDGFVYWSNEMVGPRSVITMTHALVAAPAEGVTALASKQIYASHYFTASLGLTLLFESGAASPETLVIYVNRSRVDFFDGLLGGAKRSIVRSRARSATVRILRDLKSRLEQEFQQGLDASARGDILGTVRGVGDGRGRLSTADHRTPRR
jgi:hypothetical protein